MVEKVGGYTISLSFTLLLLLLIYFFLGKDKREAKD